MPTFQAAYGNLIIYHSFGGGDTLIGKRSSGHLTTCTTNHELTHLFGVKIKKNLSRNKSGLQAVGSDKSLLFVNSEQTFNRTMHKRIIQKDSHRRRTPHTVISTQSCSIGPHPLSVNNSFDRIGKEIMRRGRQLFSHHILMPLENNCRSIFVTRSSTLTHHDIAYLISSRFNIMTVSPINQELAHTVEMMCRTWHLCNLIKTFPY